MVIEKTQARRLFRLFSTLLSFAAVDFGLSESLDDPNVTVDGDVARQLEQRIWGEGGDRTVIERYVQQNPFGFNIADLSEVRSWQDAISGEFCVYQSGFETLFVYGWRAFSVMGLDREITDIVLCTPARVRTTLLPFQGIITYAATLTGLKIDLSAEEADRLNREISDYYKLNKVHHTADEFLHVAERAQEEQISRRALELIATTESEMRRKTIGMHESPLAALSFEERQSGIAERFDAAQDREAALELVRQSCLTGQFTESFEEILCRAPSGSLFMLGSHTDAGNDVSRMSRDEIIRAILDFDLFAEEHIGWLMDMAIASGADAMIELKRLYQQDSPAAIETSAIIDDFKIAPIFPLSVLFETEDGFIMAAPKEARAALADFDFDAAIEKASAQDLVIEMLERATDMYGIVSYDEFEQVTGFASLSERYGKDFATLVLKRIVALVVNDIVRFDYFHLPDDSLFFAHRQMREYLSVEAGQRVPNFSEMPVVYGMMLSRESFSPRPLTDWGEASDVYEYLYTLEPTRAFIHFLDAHVPDTQDDYEFAERVVADIILNSRLAPTDFDIIVEWLLDEYDFNAENAVLDEFATCYQAFADHIPAWYYFGWSDADINQS